MITTAAVVIFVVGILALVPIDAEIQEANRDRD